MANRTDTRATGESGERTEDLRGCYTAFDCRDRLPELSRWMADDLLQEIRIWQGARFEPNRTYFDLDNPERGAFVATGDEGPITDHTYACRDEVSEAAWAQLVTWGQPVSEDQAHAIAIQEQQIGIGPELGPGQVDEAAALAAAARSVGGPQPDTSRPPS
jgi:hypothetical protein